MRDFLTILASAVILILTIALVGPWLVNWTAHRAWVESELSRVSGAHVQVGGAIDLKLLPVPRLSLAAVHVSGSRPDGPVLDVERLRLELAVASLLRGELRFTDAELERPRLSVSRLSDGSLVLPHMPNFAPSGVQVEHITLRDGALVLQLPDKTPIVLGGLDFVGEASSLIGPFKGSGLVRIGAEPVKYRFTTGPIEGDRLRLKAIVDESVLGPRAELEGALAFAAEGAGARASFEGTGAFSATSAIAGASVPWRLAGLLKADVAGASLLSADLRAGDEERAIAASGEVILALAPAPKVRAQFNARQLDLDRLFSPGAKPGAAAPAGARVASLVAAALADPALSERLPAPLQLTLTSPAAVLAGETLSEVRADLSLAAGAAPLVKLSGSGPARSTLMLDGAVETGAAAAFRGHAEFAARDLARFSDWLALTLPDAAQHLRDLPFRALDLAGDVEMSAAGALVRRMKLRLDRSELVGTMAFTRAVGLEKARLFADLTSDALDLDGLPELAGPARLAADMDLSLALDARAVRLARFGADFVDSGHIALKLVKDATSVRLERFAIDNVGGANLAASGVIDAGRAHLDARVDAARLGDLAGLLQRIAPGALADSFARRATALSPARLSLAVRGQDGEAGLLLKELRIEGTARGTRLALSAQAAPEATDVSAQADNPDAVMLLRQLGFDTLPLAGNGAARLQLRAKGTLAKGFETSVDLNAARSDVGFEGRVAGPFESPQLAGALRLRSPDATPLLRMLALVLPDGNASLPVEGLANLALAGGTLAFNNVAGLVAGTFVNGALRGVPEGDARRWGGDLTIDRLALPVLASLALGPMANPKPGALWPEQRFAPGLADPPRVDLRIEAGRFELSGETIARNAAFDLRIAPGIVAIENANMQLGQGKIGGQMTFRRDAASASLSGGLDLTGVDMPAGPVAGLATGHLDFTSTGQSYGALVAGLAGSGSVQIAPLAIANADPAAIARIVEASERGEGGLNEQEMRANLAREFDRAPLALERGAFEASLAAGVLRLTGKDLAPTVRLELTHDLRDRSTQARLLLSAAHMPPDWSGSPPSATLVWQAKGGAAQRVVEAVPLLNALSARAITRESARVEALEADIRERAAFNRRAKALDFMRRREREVAAFLEEQHRRELEEERLRTMPPSATDALGRFMENLPAEEAARIERERRQRRALEVLKQRAEDALRATQPAPLPPQRPQPGDPLATGLY